MITNIPNTYNYGTAMMAINFIYYLDKKFNGDVNFYVDTRTKEDLENLINSTNLNNIEINKILPDKSKIKMKCKEVNLDINWIGAYCDGIVNNYDCLMVLGGDDLSEYYATEYMINELYKINKISKNIPVFLIGQTIGPFTEWRKEYAADMLKPCQIFTRDNLTYNYLRDDLGLLNVTKSSDLAFLDLPKQNEYNLELLLGKFNLNIDDYITVIPSGLVNSYTSNYDSYIYNLIGIIEYLLDKKGFKVVLLPHVLRPEKVDDNVVIKDIIKKIGERYPNDLIYIDKMLTPLGARLILGNGLFTVTGRMHGAISTFQMEKLAISLSYSVKYKGVIGEGLECENLIVEASDDEKWNKKEVMNETISKIDYLLDNYNELIIKIKGNVFKCKEEVSYMIDEIHKEIGE